MLANKTQFKSTWWSRVPYLHGGLGSFFQLSAAPMWGMTFSRVPGVRTIVYQPILHLTNNKQGMVSGFSGEEEEGREGGERRDLESPGLNPIINRPNIAPPSTLSLSSPKSQCFSVIASIPILRKE